MSSTAITVPHKLAFEFGLLNAVPSLARAIAAFWANERLSVASRGQTESLSDDSFRQRVHFIEDVQENHQPFFFSRLIKRLQPSINPNFFFFWGFYWSSLKEGKARRCVSTATPSVTVFTILKGFWRVPIFGVVTPFSDTFGRRGRSLIDEAP